MQRFTGKQFVVTGGASGIGLGIAQRLVEEGGHVLLLDRDSARLAEAAAQLGRADRLEVDLGDAAAVVAAAQEVADRLGTVDGLVNNAGIGDASVDPWQLTVEQWDRVYAVNVRAPFQLIQRLSQAMTAGGSIVNISSGMAKRAGSGVAYCSSKAAVLGLTQVWAGPLGARGIRINAVCPGIIDTPIYHPVDRAMGQPPGSFVHQILRSMQAPAALQIALPRVGLPRDIAGVVAFLLSEDAAYVTGQSLVVDGGFLYD
jgi:NAD(P)-dependent dehydrogenase (short-subunit alcohol dehydrogenase family)